METTLSLFCLSVYLSVCLSLLIVYYLQTKITTNPVKWQIIFLTILFFAKTKFFLKIEKFENGFQIATAQQWVDLIFELESWI